jgi:enterochelin esterase-like enzyme
LSEQAYGGLVSDGHLDAVNRELARDPFEGCLVVTPYVPDLLEDSSPQELKRYVDWLAGSFLEQVRDRFEQAARGRAATGIDGVSLGGWVALEAGFRHPEVFGSVGGIQPAIRGRVSGLAARAAGARGQGHRPHIRLLTSSEDPFLEPTRDLSRALRERRVPHRLLELPGPHDYDFNRGPGRMELLRFHEQVLEQEPLGK